MIWFIIVVSIVNVIAIAFGMRYSLRVGRRWGLFEAQGIVMGATDLPKGGNNILFNRIQKRIDDKKAPPPWRRRRPA